MNKMKQIKGLKTLIIGFVLFLFQTGVQAQIFPVQTNSNVFSPAPVYLSDYYGMSASPWQITLKYLDFNQGSRNVLLYLSISGGNIHMRTSDEAARNNGLTLMAGAVQTLSGDKLDPYLNLSNIKVSGIQLAELESDLRLPEGVYDFCFEVYDELTGEKLSETSCAQVWINLNDAPFVNAPQCGELIKADLATPINFIWQQAGINSPGSLGTEYQLTLFEIMGFHRDPVSAISNGQVLEVFRSDWQFETSYQYGFNEVALEEGKQYAYLVQARDIGGRSIFKNSGFSQVCWFNYGYAQGGEITLLAPAHQSGFTKTQKQYFKWSPPNNLLEGQKCHFDLEIVELLPGQIPEQAINFNAKWFETSTPEIMVIDAWDYELKKRDKAFEKGKMYAWRVSAYSENQQIAQSSIGVFNGPPIVESFYVQNHLVEVQSVQNNNLNDLSGVGRFTLHKIGGDTLVAIFPFEHLHIKSGAGSDYLISGEINASLNKPFEITLSPDFSQNGSAILHATRFRLSNETNLDLWGQVQWPLPFAVENLDSLPHVYSDFVWTQYQEFLPAGTYPVEATKFELSAPYQFDLVLRDDGYFQVNNGDYEAHLDGALLAPTFVQGRAKGQRATYHFYNQEQLFYMHESGSNTDAELYPLAGTNLYVRPRKYTIDLTDKRSPTGRSLFWKGVFLDEYLMGFGAFLEQNQSFHVPVPFDVSFTAGDTAIAYIDYRGLSMTNRLHMTNQAGGRFKTFPAYLSSLQFDFEQNKLTEAIMEGAIQIPFLSDTDYYTFAVPLSEDGFLSGYMTESLNGIEVTFNKGKGDQEVKMKVLRAVFENDNHIKMDVSLVWDYFQLAFEYVDGFCVWGNYNVGFGAPNASVALQQRIRGMASSYELVATDIGIGRQKNLYAIGFTADIQMGEDAAGANGAPQINSYSIYKSPLIPENYTFSATMATTDYALFESDASIFQDESGEPIEFAMGDVVGEMDELFGHLEDEFKPINTRYALGEEGPVIVRSDPLPIDSITRGDTSSISLAQVYQLIDVVSLFAKEEQKAGLMDLKVRLQQMESAEVYEIYEELRSGGFSINRLLKNRVDHLVLKATAPIKTQTDKVNGHIVRFVDKLLDPVTDASGKLIDQVIDEIGELALNLVQSDKREKLQSKMKAVLDTVKLATRIEFERSVKKAVHDNVTFKVTGFIKENIVLQFTGFMEEELKQMGAALIDRDFEAVNGGEVLAGTGALLESIGEDMVHEITTIEGEHILQTIENIATQAFTNIRFRNIAEIVSQKMLQKSLELGTEQVVANLVTQLSGNENVGAVIGSLTHNVALDFSNLGEKIRHGEVDKIVAFDPSYIRVKTKAAEFEALLDFIKDDPVWGDCFKAMVAAKVKKPREFTAKAIYVNGKRKDAIVGIGKDEGMVVDHNTFNFWYIEFAVASGLNLPLIPGLLVMDGIGGKVFSRMSFDLENRSYLPDPNTRFGAGLDMYIVDQGSMGKVLRMKVTSELSILEDYFNLSIRGDAAVGFQKTDSDRPSFKATIANGFGQVTFSSKDNHLIGKFTVQTNTAPLFCASGELGLDIGDGSWSVYMGKASQPISMKVLCLDLIKMASFFQINPQRLDVGLMMHVDLYARSPWFEVLKHQVRPYLGFEFYLETLARLQFQPKIALEEALLELEVFAGIGCEWKKKDKSGTWDLASARFSGLAHYKNTTEQAYVRGQLAGKISILGLKFDVNMNVDKDLKS